MAAPGEPQPRGWSRPAILSTQEASRSLDGDAQARRMDRRRGEARMGCKPWAPTRRRRRRRCSTAPFELGCPTGTENVVQTYLNLLCSAARLQVSPPTAVHTAVRLDQPFWDRLFLSLFSPPPPPKDAPLSSQEAAVLAATLGMLLFSFTTAYTGRRRQWAAAAYCLLLFALLPPGTRQSAAQMHHAPAGLATDAARIIIGALASVAGGPVAM